MCYLPIAEPNVSKDDHDFVLFKLLVIDIIIVKDNLNFFLYFYIRYIDIKSVKC